MINLKAHQVWSYKKDDVTIERCIAKVISWPGSGRDDQVNSRSRSNPLDPWATLVTATRAEFEGMLAQTDAAFVGLSYQVEVTQEDIDLGCPNRTDQCMIARAICRALECWVCSVDANGILHAYGYQFQRDIANYPCGGPYQLYSGVQLSQIVVEQIHAFDNGDPVKPFIFELFIPKDSINDLETTTD